MAILNILNNPPAVIGVGGGGSITSCALLPLLRSSLVPFPGSGPPARQAAWPARRAGPAAWLASPGRPDSASLLGRPAERAELVWDHLGVQNGIVGHQIVNCGVILKQNRRTRVKKVKM